MKLPISLAAGILLLAPLSLCSRNCPHEADDLVAWEDSKNWPRGHVPKKNERVDITRGYLLSGTTERLKFVTVKKGGKIVFNPSAEPKLIASQVVIEDGGEINIGKGNCRYYGQAEILLTGKSTDNIRNHTHFGMKFIGVEAGGHFTVAGPKSKTWTRLTKTITPNKKSFSTLVDGELPKEGFHFLEFDKDGKFLKKTLQINTLEDALPVINGLAVGSDANPHFFVLVKFGYVQFKLWNVYREEFAAALEAKLNLPQNSLSKLRAQEDRGDPYMLLWHTNEKRFPLEEHSAVDSAFASGNPRKLVVTDRNWGDLNIDATIEVPKPGEDGPPSAFLEVFNEKINDYTIEVQEGDIDRWRAGDRIVIASTDFNFRQAEEFTVHSKPAANKIRFLGELKYEHFGATSMGVDMFAEVGKLSQKIKIHGEMQDTCYDEKNQHCSRHGFTHDTFGGHIMILEGFGSFEMTGAEIYDMGQTTVLGRYPIHFHRARDTKGTRVEYNSIHDTHSRCVTVHASDYVQINNNVCSNHKGHGFFLEDGAEKYTNFTQNLGLGTSPGVVTLGDSEPSTFWITSPLTYMVGNAAAGSGEEGVGIWYLFPDEPVGLSTGEGQFVHEEAKYTLILTHKDNVVHSNGNDGIAFFKRLGTKHEIIGCSTYSPRAIPLDETSDYVPIHFMNVIGYKNRNHGFVARASATEILNGQFADNRVGVLLHRNHLNGYSIVRNCTFVGQSENKGVSEILITGKGERTFSDRSYPRPLKGWLPISGVTIWHEGPSHVHNCTFRGFKHTKFHNSSAIMWNDNYNYASGITSSTKELVFDFKDPEEGFHMWNPDAYDHESKAKEHSIGFIDLDGTLTGNKRPPVYTYKHDAYFLDQEADKCYAKSHWNMVVCRKRFTRIYMSPYVNGTTKTWMTDEKTKTLYNPNKSEVGNLMSFTLDPNQVGVLHWSTNMPDKFSMSMGGLQKGDKSLIGFCLPRGSVKSIIAGGDKVLYKVVKLEPNVTMTFADSLADLGADAGKNFYMDAHRDIIYRKYFEIRERKPTDLSDCIDGLNFGAYCPYFAIHLNNLDISAEKLAWGANCETRLKDLSVPL